MDTKEKEAWCSEHQTSKYEIASAANTNDFDLDDISDFGDVQLPVCRCYGVIGQNFNRINYLFKTAGFEDSDFVCRFCKRCVGKGT